jgi:hypothetical protein
MYIYIYICIYIYIYTHIHICVYIYIYEYTYVYLHTHIYTLAMSYTRFSTSDWKFPMKKGSKQLILFDSSLVIKRVIFSHLSYLSFRTICIVGRVTARCWPNDMSSEHGNDSHNAEFPTIVLALLKRISKRGIDKSSALIPCICIYIHVYIYTHICIYVYIYIYIYIYTDINICIHTYMCIYLVCHTGQYPHAEH